MGFKEVYEHRVILFWSHIYYYFVGQYPSTSSKFNKTRKIKKIN